MKKRKTPMARREDGTQLPHSQDERRRPGPSPAPDPDRAVGRPLPHDDVRHRLKALIAERGEDYAGLSRFLGRNPSYIQQYLTRGTPRRLAEEDRRRLALRLGVDETELGAPPRWPSERRLLSVPVGPPGDGPEPGARDWLLVPFLGLTGRVAEAEPHDAIAFEAGFVRALARGRLGALAAVRVEGDTMAPTLLAGDQLLVDADAIQPVRDGLHVLRIDGALAVRRIAVHPATRRLSLLADNCAYPSFPDCDPAALSLLGRVVWVGRRLA